MRGVLGKNCFELLDGRVVVRGAEVEHRVVELLLEVRHIAVNSYRTPPPPKQGLRDSHLALLPFAAAKDHNPHHASNGFGYENGPIYAILIDNEFQREQISQRNFQQPKAKEVDPG